MHGERPNRQLLDAEILARVRTEVSRRFDAALSEEHAFTLGLPSRQRLEVLNEIFDYVLDDLQAYATRDPRARKQPQSILGGENDSFKAVLCYRVARSIITCEDLDPAVREDIAQGIREAAKAETGIEIDPGARIGRRFVIDHGIGSVIGETCEIGEECYILECVILGAQGISDNPPGKRHPTLGNNVRVGAFARVFGPVTIGDNVEISSHCVVDRNIPADSRVVIVNQLQILRPDKLGDEDQRISLYGVIPGTGGQLSIRGKGFSQPLSLALVDEEYSELDALSVDVLSTSSTSVKARITSKNCKLPKKLDALGRVCLRLDCRQQSFVLTYCVGVREVLQSVLSKGS